MFYLVLVDDESALFVVLSIIVFGICQLGFFEGSGFYFKSGTYVLFLSNLLST